MPIQQKLTPPVLLFSDFAGWDYALKGYDGNSLSSRNVPYEFMCTGLGLRGWNKIHAFVVYSSIRFWFYGLGGGLLKH